MTDSWQKIKISNGRLMEGSFSGIQDFDLSAFTGTIELVYHFIDRETFSDKKSISSFTPSLKKSFAFIGKQFINALPIVHFCRDFEAFDRYLDIRPDAPRYIQFLDSSIWQRIAWNVKELQKRINEIKEWSDNGYYNLVIAKEIANLHVRLVQNAFILGPANGNTKNTHAAAVSPFLFHSENKMRKLLEEQTSKSKDILSKGLKWRFLLVDDHSANEMTGGAGLTKKKIIEQRLDEICGIFHARIQLDLKRESVFEIDFVTNIQDAKNALCSKRYDIILLDYLLGEIDTKREYSYLLLDEISNVLAYEDTDNINEHKRNEYEKWMAAKGIYEKFWFFHISAFTSAIEERLQERGFTHNSASWHIARGACPTTTPELFKYNLFMLMLRQIEIITSLPVVKAPTRQPKEKIITLIELLVSIYANSDLVRENARQNFNSLLKIQANYQILKRDCDYNGNNSETNPNGSSLIQALFPDVNSYVDSFWEHLMHLVYLTAYGTIRQWPEMWEEFLFIDPILRNAQKKVYRTSSQSESVSTLIEIYIINLKEAS